MDGGFHVRAATADDAMLIGRQRAAMWREMGRVDEAGEREMAEVTRAHVERLMGTGGYHGWLAFPLSEPERPIAGVGIHVREALPRLDPSGHVTQGVQALVVNVYTEPAWRRRGVALRLMRDMLAWCARAGITNIILHASDDGRPLYEKLGFVPTNEMRYVPPSA